MRADRVVRPYRMFRIRKTPPDSHHQDRVRRGVRRSQLHSVSAEAAKAPYPLAPSSFPNCDRCAGSQFGVIWGGEIDWASELLHDGSTVYATGFESSLSFLHRARQFFSFSKRERKEWGRKSDGQGRFRCSRKSQSGSFWWDRAIEWWGRRDAGWARNEPVRSAAGR